MTPREIEQEVGRLTDEGDDLMNAGDVQAAAECFAAALRLDPTHAGPHPRSGRAT